MKIRIILTGLILAAGCSMKPDAGLSIRLDLSPPRLLEIRGNTGPEVILLFDEPVFLPVPEIQLDSGERGSAEVIDTTGVRLLPEEELVPGGAYKTSLTVEDRNGNSNHFILQIWGWNPAVPAMLINEFNPEGSGNNPDTIEILFLEDGNTAGAVLYYGSEQHREFRYILPDLSVRKGEFLLIHCRPEGGQEEIDERERKDESGGKLASDSAWDLWLPEDAGLSGRNGILTLYSAPGGALLDGVIYSNRAPDPEDALLGWTTRTFDAAADLYESGAWRFSDEDISPLEAIRSDYTTGTRSLCRSSASEDTDSSGDWHTVPTGGKTFGEINRDEVFIPPE